MKETIDMLQTLMLFIGVLLQAVTLVMVVYCFNLLLKVLRDMTHTSHEVSRTTVTASIGNAEPSRVPDPVVSPIVARYLCKCKARLPENPISSRINGETVILIYKCGRCGKESEINPATTPPSSNK